MNLTQNRAAVICLGGWGLQLMLNLNPRLQAIQQQRYFTGANRNTPSLRDVIRVVTCMPRTHYPDNVVNSHQMLDFYSPNISQFPSSFELEQIAQRPIANLHNSDSTYSEVFAEALCRDAMDHNWIERMSFVNADNTAVNVEASQCGYHVTRAEYLEYMLRNADTIATWLQRGLIEPTLLDRIAPSESLLQTNIYIVASLTEPLTSVMIWPLLAALKRALGTGRVVQMTGIFNIGSFAVEQHIALESSCVHVALSELEVLMGMGMGVANKYSHMRSAFAEHYPDYKRDPGDSYELLDQIYLLDRNKENFSLSASSAENAISATNFIESSLVSLLPQSIAESAVRRNIRQEIRDASQTSRVYNSQFYPYSSFGAYICNVPLMDYLMSATAVQSSDLRKMLKSDEQVLSNKHQDFLGSFRLDYDALQQILIEQTARLNLLFDRNALPPLHQRFIRWLQHNWASEWVQRQFTQRGWFVANRSSTSNTNVVQMPAMSPRYYTRDLEDIRHYTLYEQRTRLINHRQRVRARIDADINLQFFQTIWGTDFVGLRSNTDTHMFRSLEEARQIISGVTAYTWTERALSDRRSRIFPKIIADVMMHVQELIVANPRGLARAVAYVSGFYTQVVRRQDDVNGDAQILTEQLQYGDGQLERDQQSWDKVMARHQRRMMSWQYVITQAFMMSVIIILTLLLYIWQTAPQSDIYMIFAVVCVFSLAVFAGWFLWMGVQRLRARRLITRLTHIHIQHMTSHVNIIVNNGISRLYGHVKQFLEQFRTILVSSEQRTFEGYIERNEQTVNGEISDSHVREVIRNPALWAAVRSFVNQQVRQDGMNNREWFEQTWASDKLNTPRPLNRVVINRTLELFFNMQMVRLICEARAIIDQYGKQTTIPPDYAQDQAYITIRDRYTQLGSPNDNCILSGTPINSAYQNDECKVCVRLCALRNWNEASLQNNLDQNRYTQLIGQTLTNYNIYDGIDGHIERALAYLQDKNGTLAPDSTFANEIMQQYNIEQLLSTMFRSALDLDTEVERMIRHAKTNINYETVDAQDIIETNHVILYSAEQSVLQESFSRRRFSVISGGDPFNLAVIRTNHMLQRRDFPSCEDARERYAQIASSDCFFIDIPVLKQCYTVADSEKNTLSMNVPVFRTRVSIHVGSSGGDESTPEEHVNDVQDDSPVLTSVSDSDDSSTSADEQQRHE